MTRQPTAVVLRAIGLGDMITGLPAMALLRRSLPNHHIVAALPHRFAAIVLATALVDTVVPTDDLGPLPGAPYAPELAVDLHGNGRASRQPLLDLAPRRLLAYPISAAWDPGEHEVARWCRLVAGDLSSGPPFPSVAGLLPRLPPAAGLPPGFTVVHPGASAGARRWPLDRYAELIIELSRGGHQVVVTGTGPESALVHRLTGRTGALPLLDLPVQQLLGSVAAARLVISGDTGVAHAAAAYQRPSVTLFGPVSPALWGPPDHPRHQVVYPRRPDDRPGDPHADRPDPVLLRIGVSDVLTAADKATHAPT